MYIFSPESFSRLDSVNTLIFIHFRIGFIQTCWGVSRFSDQYGKSAALATARPAWRLGNWVGVTGGMTCLSFRVLHRNYSPLQIRHQTQNQWPLRFLTLPMPPNWQRFPFYWAHVNAPVARNATFGTKAVWFLIRTRIVNSHVDRAGGRVPNHFPSRQQSQAGKHAQKPKIVTIPHANTEPIDETAGERMDE